MPIKADGDCFTITVSLGASNLGNSKLIIKPKLAIVILNITAIIKIYNASDMVI